MLPLFITILTFRLCQAGTSTVSLRWPDGVYGLPKPTSGCPEEWKNNGWEENGRIEQKIISHSNRLPNDKSDRLHMAGYVKPKHIVINFCISKATGSTGRPTWPKGEYCIYSKHGIKGMLKGYIRLYNWESRTSANETCRKSFLEVIWHHAILFRFKCQTRGNKKIPISLPITKPFYLLPYGSRDCQQVQWMIATSEWIKDYTYYYGYRDGRTPYHVNVWPRSELTMYYCYYKSCNYTLTEKKGVFHSPGFPDQYPDGQLCSWKIMVPDNHILHVHFTHYSLYEYDKDCLQLYENDNGSFKPRQTFFGYEDPFNITTNNEVMFVFRSDEENNSTGFQAEYEVLKIPERTTTTKPPTTTTPPPTTTKLTTKPTTTKLPTTKQATTTMTTNKLITTEETTFEPTATNSTTNDTWQCNPPSTKNKSYDKHSSIQPLREKTCFCDETWRIVVMVIPLAVLIVLVSIDIFCRCRSKEAIKNGTDGSSANDEMVVNPVYERGNIILDQPNDSVTVASTVNTTDQPQSRDELPDYEDVDYTQLNDIPPPRRLSKRQECYALEPVGADNSAVFYHVLEPSMTEPNGTQSHSTERVCAGAPDVFYHTLEHPTHLNPPTYQNLSKVNQYTMNPLYGASDNSPPLVEANRLYDNYMA